MESTILVLALSLIRAAVKNPRKKEKLKKIMLEIRDAIDAAFANGVTT